MRLSKIHIAIIATLPVVFQSCQELYIPDEIVTEIDIPVIQGTITEGSLPVVKLSYASVYLNDNQRQIHDAEVTVTDNTGGSVELFENDEGYYVPLTNDYLGIMGNVYRLNVNIDGEEFESQPVKLNAKPVVDSLYALPGYKESFTYNQSGQIIYEFKEGLNILMDLSADHDSTYYRFNTTTLHEITYTDATNALMPVSIWEWYTDQLDEVYSVDLTYPKNNLNILPQHKNGFLQYIFLPNEDVVSQKNYTTYGWVLTIRVFSISKSVYDYYNSIDKQFNSNNQIFAPVPAQIKSNIKCTTDSDRLVVGVFEASSETILYRAFQFLDRNNYRSISLTDFPQNILHGISRTSPPSFWISF